MLRRMDASTFGLIIGWIIGAAVGLLALYGVIYFAVLNALRAHVVSSDTSVKIVGSVPLRVEQEHDTEHATSHQQ